MDSGEKGAAIFLDVFRRADKNDDGAISWEEFKSYFADGVLSETELRNLFSEIDTHNTNNLDTGELCTYFSHHLGAFKEVFGAVEELNTTISKALVESAEGYKGASFLEQFLNRFLLREISTQLHAVQQPVDVASDALDEQALLAKDASEASNQSGQTQLANEPVYKRGLSDSGVVPGRVGRRARRQQPSVTPIDTGEALSKQVDRLQHLLDCLETRVSLDVGVEEVVSTEDEKMMQIVHSHVEIKEDSLTAFKESLRNYVEATNEDAMCLHLSVRTYAKTNKYRIYEIWESEEAWKNHMGQDVYRTFQHKKVDQLETPEQVSTMQLPDSWWKRDD